jgi:uncharacterized membrane protein
MTLLTVGVLLWSVVHLFPSIAPRAREMLVERLGNNPYRGLFAAAIVTSLVLIIIGWRSASVAGLYPPPLLGSPIVPALVLLAFILLAAANAPTNIRRFIRHPMLTGVVVWGVAHLLANGENRSVVLFGGMSLWALISIFSISHRDGPREKPATLAVTKDVITVAVSCVVFAAVLYFHGALFGVSAIVGL